MDREIEIDKCIDEEIYRWKTLYIAMGTYRSE